MIIEKNFKDVGFNYPIFRHKSKRLFVNGENVLQSCIRIGVHGKAYEASRDNTLLSNLINDNENTIISEECFYVRPLPDGVKYDEGRRLIYKKLSDYLIESGFDKITFVVYFRQQHEHVASSWRETTKHINTYSFHEYSKSKHCEYVHDYHAFIKVMEECIEIPHEIIVRIYDRNNFVGGDIYHDFCDAIGIPWSDEYVIPEKERTPSLSYDVTEALRTIRPYVKHG